LVFKELKNFREKKLGTLQLHRAKQQIAGQLAISLESNVNEMLSIGKSRLFFEEVDTYQQISKRVDGITSLELLDVAYEIFIPENFSMLTYLPNKNGDE
jgi:predicted Zn-dependent peptidase